MAMDDSIIATSDSLFTKKLINNTVHCNCCPKLFTIVTRTTPGTISVLFRLRCQGWRRSREFSGLWCL